MFRTQIYLTEKEKKALNPLMVRSGKSQSELIRTAIDRLIENPIDFDEIIEKKAGLWKKRLDLPNYKTLRAEVYKP